MTETESDLLSGSVTNVVTSFDRPKNRQIELTEEEKALILGPALQWAQQGCYPSMPVVSQSIKSNGLLAVAKSTEAELDIEDDVEDPEEKAHIALFRKLQFRITRGLEDLSGTISASAVPAKAADVLSAFFEREDCLQKLFAKLDGRLAHVLMREDNRTSRLRKKLNGESAPGPEEVEKPENEDEEKLRMLEEMVRRASEETERMQSELTHVQDVAAKEAADMKKFRRKFERQAEDHRLKTVALCNGISKIRAGLRGLAKTAVEVRCDLDLFVRHDALSALSSAANDLMQPLPALHAWLVRSPEAEQKEATCLQDACGALLSLFNTASEWAKHASTDPGRRIEAYPLNCGISDVGPPSPEGGAMPALGGGKRKHEPPPSPSSRPPPPKFGSLLQYLKTPCLAGMPSRLMSGKLGKDKAPAADKASALIAEWPAFAPTDSAFRLFFSNMVRAVVATAEDVFSSIKKAEGLARAESSKALASVQSETAQVLEAEQLELKAAKEEIIELSAELTISRRSLNDSHAAMNRLSADLAKERGTRESAETIITRLETNARPPAVNTPALSPEHTPKQAPSSPPRSPRRRSRCKPLNCAVICLRQATRSLIARKRRRKAAAALFLYMSSRPTTHTQLVRHVSSEQLPSAPARIAVTPSSSARQTTPGESIGTASKPESRGQYSSSPFAAFPEQEPVQLDQPRSQDILQHRLACVRCKKDSAEFLENLISDKRQRKVWCWNCGVGPFRNLGPCPACRVVLFYGVSIAEDKKRFMLEEYERAVKKWISEHTQSRAPLWHSSRNPNANSNSDVCKISGQQGPFEEDLGGSQSLASPKRHPPPIDAQPSEPSAAPPRAQELQAQLFAAPFASADPRSYDNSWKFLSETAVHNQNASETANFVQDVDIARYWDGATTSAKVQRAHSNLLPPHALTTQSTTAKETTPYLTQRAVAGSGQSAKVWDLGMPVEQPPASPAGFQARRSVQTLAQWTSRRKRLLGRHYKTIGGEYPMNASVSGSFQLTRQACPGSQAPHPSRR
eukprot:gene6439-9857_t